MPTDINPQEFAKAWRTVSEYLLQAILNISTTDPAAGVPLPPATPAEGDDATQPSCQEVAQTPKASSEPKDTRYATCPIRQSDNTYVFKHLKDEKKENSIFKIIRYTDGSCEITVCDLCAEARQTLKDTRAETMPSAVGTIIGDITADSKIVNIRPGKGLFDGRLVRIIEPLEVEFK
ncbi:MAG: hypothetical protein K2G78_01555 [Muribaculaceae bacterium]|nr:hypothetical protein [Muribaculaceae bacterium]